MDDHHGGPRGGVGTDTVEVQVEPYILPLGEIADAEYVDGSNRIVLVETDAGSAYQLKIVDPAAARRRVRRDARCAADRRRPRSPADRGARRGGGRPLAADHRDPGDARRREHGAGRLGQSPPDLVDVAHAGNCAYGVAGGSVYLLHPLAAGAPVLRRGLVPDLHRRRTRPPGTAPRPGPRPSAGPTAPWLWLRQTGSGRLGRYEIHTNCNLQTPYVWTDTAMAGKSGLWLSSDAQDLFVAWTSVYDARSATLAKRFYGLPSLYPDHLETTLVGSDLVGAVAQRATTALSTFSRVTVDGQFTASASRAYPFLGFNGDANPNYGQFGFVRTGGGAYYAIVRANVGTTAVADVSLGPREPRPVAGRAARGGRPGAAASRYTAAHAQGARGPPNDLPRLPRRVHGPGHAAVREPGRGRSTSRTRAAPTRSRSCSAPPGSRSPGSRSRPRSAGTSRRASRSSASDLPKGGEPPFAPPPAAEAGREARVLGLGPVLGRVASWFHRRDITVWYDPRYRLPMSGLEAVVGFDPRRPDFAAWWLRESGAVARGAVRRPHRISYENLARVHAPELLESLGRAEALAAIFSVDPSDVPVDEVMTTVRLACGGTLAGARETLRTRAPALNLLGGFHHAAPAAAGGNCPVNDVAVAVATLRAEGFAGRIAVLDLDAHPPDGLAACLAGDPERLDRLPLRLGLGPPRAGGRDGAAGGDRRRGVPRRARRAPRPDAAAAPRVRARGRRRPRGRPVRPPRPHPRRRAGARPARGGGARLGPDGVAPGGRLHPRRVAGARRDRHGARRRLPRLDPRVLRSDRGAVRARVGAPLPRRAHRVGRAHVRGDRRGPRDPAAAAAPPARLLHRRRDGARALPLRAVRSARADGVPAVPRGVRRARRGRAGAHPRAGGRRGAPPHRGGARAAARLRRGGALRALALAAQPARPLQRPAAAAAGAGGARARALPRDRDDARAHGGAARPRRASSSAPPTSTPPTPRGTSSSSWTPTGRAGSRRSCATCATCRCSRRRWRSPRAGCG